MKSSPQFLQVGSHGRSLDGADERAAAGFRVRGVRAGEVAPPLRREPRPALVMIHVDGDSLRLLRELVATRALGAPWVPIVACCKAQGARKP